MDSWFQFTIHQESSEEEALEELSPCRLSEISVIEDIDSKQQIIYAKADESFFPNTWTHILSYAKLATDEIDWQNEWDQFSPYFKNGIAQVPLSDFCPESTKILTLLPGPGFGDLSHPTTRLSLRLLSQYTRESILIDLGCGSGVLSLAALLWGADFVYGLDIEPQALVHSQKNAIENQLGSRLFLGEKLPQNPSPTPTLFVMNMTFGEQKAALESLSDLPSRWIVSGILEEQKDAYLAWVQTKGMQIKTCLSEDGWIACLFEQG